jgi:hypothetical protein
MGHMTTTGTSVALPGTERWVPGDRVVKLGRQKGFWVLGSHTPVLLGNCYSSSYNPLAK